ncbi:MAG TPA: alpha-glucosidase C-terminal domain-containing protein, partial [Candidatus Ligilactobacillus excrementavium]|nr:alpha-glucosidase C-terminal domain-containing protein [Candidatus Ligilactobacillus excrementavium]
DIYAYKRSFDTHQAFIFCNLTDKKQEITLPEPNLNLRIKIKNQANLDRTNGKVILKAYGTIVLDN